MTNLVSREELERKIKWVLDTRHTVPVGQSHSVTYTGRLADLFESLIAQTLKEAIPEKKLHKNYQGYELYETHEDSIYNQAINDITTFLEKGKSDE